MRLVPLAAVIALAGCATQPEWYWYKEGATDAQFTAESGQCRAQAFSVAGAALQQVAIVYTSCLQGKGWIQRPRG